MGNHTGRPSPETAQEICAAYVAGTDLLRLSREYGVSYYHAKRVVMQAGIPLRSRGELNSLRRPHIDRAELRRILDEGKLTHYETAQHFGVSTSTLTRAMRAFGWKSVKGKGSPLERNYFWRGGRVLDSDGYVLVKSPDHPRANNSGYVREHRLVMEKKLGRYLLPNEVVHHRGAKTDNDPDQLEVFQSNAEHLRHELTGKRPNYTPAGLQRMRENALRVNLRRLKSTRGGKGSDDLP